MGDDGVKMFIYRIPPIDFGWDMMPTIPEAVVRIGSRTDPYDLNTGAQLRTIRDLLAFRDAAIDKAFDCGWEGDFRPGHEPHVFFLPHDTEMVMALIWKQENNGDTFIASPIPLAYLAEEAT